MQGVLAGPNADWSAWVALWTPSRLPYITPLGEAEDRVVKVAGACTLEGGLGDPRPATQAYAECLQGKLGATVVIVARTPDPWPIEAYSPNSLIKVSAGSNGLSHTIYVLPPTTWYKARAFQGPDAGPVRTPFSHRPYQRDV